MTSDGVDCVALDDATRGRLNTILWLILFLALAVRLVRITDPYADDLSWRQADVAMIARNLLHDGFDFLHPRVDWSAHTSGVVGTEFPLLPLAVAATWEITGVNDWVGRLLPAILYCISGFYFFKLVALVYNSRIALWSTAFYLFTPLAIQVSRSLMPDSVALSFAILGLYNLVLWDKRGRLARLLLAAVFFSLAVLTKAPYGLFLLPALYVLCRKRGVAALAGGTVILAACVAMVPALLWYLHASAIPTAVLKIDGSPHIFGEQAIGLPTINDALTVGKMIWRYFTPLVIVLAMGGMIVGKRCEYKYLPLLVLAGISLFLLGMGPGNAMHRWYQLPLVFVTSIWAARLVARIPNLARVQSSLATVAAVLLPVLLLNAYLLLRETYELWNLPCVRMAQSIARLIPPSARVLIPDDGDPSCLYYTDRKGWHLWNALNGLDSIKSIENFRAMGATHVIFDPNHYWWLTYYRDFGFHMESNYSKVISGDDYAVFDLNTSVKK